MAEGMANYQGWPESLRKYAMSKSQPTLESRIDNALDALDRKENAVHEQKTAEIRQETPQPEPAKEGKPVQSPRGRDTGPAHPKSDNHRPMKQGAAVAQGVKETILALSQEIDRAILGTENPRVIAELKKTADELEGLSLVIAGAVEDQYGMTI